MARSSFVPAAYGVETYVQDFNTPGLSLSDLIDTTSPTSLPDDEAFNRMNDRNRANPPQQNYPPFFPSFLTFRVNYLAANSDTCYKTHAADPGSGSVTPASQGVNMHALSANNTFIMRAYDLDDFSRLSDSSYQNRHHIGGMISLERFHSQRRGYWDIRLRQNTLEQGHHFALWLLPIRRRFATSSAIPEIDIVEMVDSNASFPNGGLQLWSWNNHGNSEFPLPSDDTGFIFERQSDPVWAAYHNFGFEWNENQLIWTVDGVVKKQSQNWSNDNFEMYLLLTWETRVVPGDFPNQANAGTTWPAEMEIDYIRVYTRGAAPAPPPASPPQSVRINELTAIRDTGLSNGGTGTISVPAGTNRALVAGFFQAGPTANLPASGLGIGGTDFDSSIKGDVRVGPRTSNGNYPGHLELFTFNEADLIRAGASAGSDFSMTIRSPGSLSGGFQRCFAGVYDTVDQDDLIVDSGLNVGDHNDSSIDPIGLETVGGGYAAAFLIWDSPDDSSGFITWGSDLTEDFDITPDFAYSGASSPTDGTSISVAPTISDDLGFQGSVLGALSLRLFEESVRGPVLQDWTVVTEGDDFTVPAGSDRLLVVAAHLEGTNVALTGVTYGDQSFVTGRISTNTTSGVRNSAGIFYLDENDIRSATGTVINVQHGGSTEGAHIFALVLQKVNQTSPLRDNDGNQTTGNAPLSALSLDTANEGYVAAIIGTANQNRAVAWNPGLEQRSELAQDGYLSSVARAFGSGLEVSVNPGVSPIPFRSALAAASFALQPGTLERDVRSDVRLSGFQSSGALTVQNAATSAVALSGFRARATIEGDLSPGGVRGDAVLQGFQSSASLLVVGGLLGIEAGVSLGGFQSRATIEQEIVTPRAGLLVPGGNLPETSLNQLRNAISRWTAKSDLGVDLDTILLIADAKIRREIRMLEQEVDLVITTNDRGEAVLPAGFLGFRSIEVQNAPYPETEYLPPDALRKVKAEPGFSARQTVQYTIESGKLKTTANSSMTFDTTFTQWFSPLTDDDPSNELLARAFDVYLYASLEATYEFLQDEQIAAYYRGKYNEAKEGIVRQERYKRTGAGPMSRRIRRRVN